MEREIKLVLTPRRGDLIWAKGTGPYGMIVLVYGRYAAPRLRENPTRLVPFKSHDPDVDRPT
jgi:hypothetical protein